jgi:hypothetical protein
MWEYGGRWIGLLERPLVEVDAPTREGCLQRLREAGGLEAVLTVEVIPPLAGVAEAAAIMGWDKRRVITYLNRGSFPQPFAALASGRVWRREDVESFAAAWSERRARREGTAPSDHRAPARP